MSKPFTLGAAALLILATSHARAVEPATAPAPSGAPAAAPAFTEAKVVVDGGYKPSTVEVVAGRPIRLTFEKKDFSGCTREVVFPKFDVRKSLPTNTPVVIELPAQPVGEIEFHCGMKMVKGKLLVVAAPVK